MRTALALALVAALLPARPAAQSVSRAPVWPPPPQPARIRFIRTLSPAAVRGRPSGFRRFLRLLTGGSPEPEMAQPYGVAVGADHRVYVADTVGGVIHIYDVDKPAYSSLKVDAQSLIGVALAGGRIIVTDSVGGRVICLDKKGHVVWTLGRGDGFERPTGIAAGLDRLYVVDTLANRVVIVRIDGVVVGTFGGRGAEPGQFNFPTNITRRRDGHLFVTDSMNFRVQELDEDGRPLRAFGQLGDGSGDFDKPKGVAIDSAGDVYVVEGLNDVVQVFDGTGRLLLAFGGSGFGDGQFWLPSGIAIANDVVYVADSANRRVQMFQYLKGPQ